MAVVFVVTSSGEMASVYVETCDVLELVDTTFSTDPATLSQLCNMSKADLLKLASRGGIALGSRTTIEKIAEALISQWSKVCNAEGDNEDGSITKTVKVTKADLVTEAKNLGITKVLESKSGKYYSINSFRGVNQDILNEINKFKAQHLQVAADTTVTTTLPQVAETEADPPLSLDNDSSTPSIAVVDIEVTPKPKSKNKLTKESTHTAPCPFEQTSSDSEAEASFHSMTIIEEVEVKNLTSGNVMSINGSAAIALDDSLDKEVAAPPPRKCMPVCTHQMAPPDSEVAVPYVDSEVAGPYVDSEVAVPYADTELAVPYADSESAPALFTVAGDIVDTSALDWMHPDIEEFSIIIENIAGKPTTYQVYRNMSIDLLKQYIAAREDILPDYIVLTFAGKLLEDTMLLKDCGIIKDSSLELSVKAHGGAPKTIKKTTKETSMANKYIRMELKEQLQKSSKFEAANKCIEVCKRIVKMTDENPRLAMKVVLNENTADILKLAHTKLNSSNKKDSRIAQTGEIIFSLLTKPLKADIAELTAPIDSLQNAWETLS